MKLLRSGVIDRILYAIEVANDGAESELLAVRRFWVDNLDIGYRLAGVARNKVDQHSDLTQHRLHVLNAITVYHESLPLILVSP